MDFIRHGLNILVEGRIRDGGLDLTKLCHLVLVSGSHNDVARYSDKANEYGDQTVSFASGTATFPRRPRPRQFVRLSTPPERLLFPACTCWELGGHDLVGQDCGPPSPLPEGTAIPSAGTIPSGLPCRSSGLAQEQDMSSMHTDRILPPRGATATNLCQSCTCRYCRQGMFRWWPVVRSSS